MSCEKLRFLMMILTILRLGIVTCLDFKSLALINLFWPLLLFFTTGNLCEQVKFSMQELNFSAVKSDYH